MTDVAVIDELLVAAESYLRELRRGTRWAVLVRSCVDYDPAAMGGFRMTKKAARASARGSGKWSPELWEREARLLGLLRGFVAGDCEHEAIFSSHCIDRPRGAEILETLDRVEELSAMRADVLRGLEVDVAVSDDCVPLPSGRFYDLDRLDSLGGCARRLGLAESSLRVYKQRFVGSFPRPVYDCGGVALFDHLLVAAWHEGRVRARVSK